jgi:ABC-type sugar transport system substrate-binding protein
MDRRTFVAGTSAVLLASPLAVEAQQSPSTARAFTPTVGMVTFTPAFHDSFVSALRQLGYEESRNIVIDWRRSPTGEQPDLEDLIRRKPDCLPRPPRVGRKRDSVAPRAFARNEAARRVVG